MSGRTTLNTNSNFIYAKEAHECIESLKKNECFEYELTYHDYKKLDDLMAFPTRAFKMGIREKYIDFRPQRGQLVRLNFGISTGSLSQGCHFGIVIQTDYKNETSPITFVAPIRMVRKKNSYMIPIQKTMFENISEDAWNFIASKYICIDEARPCSIGSFISDADKNYSYGNLNKYGNKLLLKPILRLFGLYELLDLVDNKRTKHLRDKRHLNKTSSLTTDTDEADSQSIDLVTNPPAPEFHEKETTKIKKSNINSKKNKKKKKQKMRKKKR